MCWRPGTASMLVKLQRPSRAAVCSHSRVGDVAASCLCCLRPPYIQRAGKINRAKPVGRAFSSLRREAKLLLGGLRDADLVMTWSPTDGPAMPWAGHRSAPLIIAPRSSHALAAHDRRHNAIHSAYLSSGERLLRTIVSRLPTNRSIQESTVRIQSIQ